MASCLQKIPSGNESRAEGENDEMGIPNYRERSRLNDCCFLEEGSFGHRTNIFTKIGLGPFIKFCLSIILCAFLMR